MPTIRLAETGDLEATISLDDIARSDRRRVALIRRTVERGCCLVCQTEARIVGYGALEYSFYDNGFISSLYVDAELRRQGIGSRLMQQLEAMCATQKLFTSTNLSNLRMQGLLTKLGYQLSGVIENLDLGDPELVYFKRLARRVTPKDSDGIL